MSEIKVNSVKGVGASTAAITLNNSDGTCTANITNRSNRNLIINGSMQIAQRGTTSTDGGYYTVDRFRVDYGGHDEAPTQSQVAVTSGGAYDSGFRKCLKVTNGNQTGSSGAGDYVQILPRLEAQNVANSGWNYLSTTSYITLSFWIKSSVAQVYSGSLRAEDGTSRSFKFDTPSLTANTWTKVTKKISGNAGLSFDDDNNNGLSVYLFPFIGTTYTSSNSNTETWITSATDTYANNMTSTWWTTNDATLEVTGFQLELGSTPTDFDHKSFGEDLALCQRYTIAFDLLGSVDNFMVLCQGRWFSGTQAQCYLPFPNEMREPPTIDAANTSAVGTFFLNSSGTLGGAAMTSLVLNERSNKGMTFTCENGASGQTAGLGTTIYCDGTDDAKLVITAEI